MAREAVDVGGHGVLVVDGRAASHGVRPRPTLAGQFFRERGGAQAENWARRHDGAWLERDADGRGLVARRLGYVGFGETMWLLTQRTARRGHAARERGADTAREAEVLSWIAKGKTNRDIGDILGMSPRTVNKHLEHVFEKLGVETRTAAAALASRECADVLQLRLRACRLPTRGSGRRYRPQRSAAVCTGASHSASDRGVERAHRDRAAGHLERGDVRAGQVAHRP